MNSEIKTIENHINEIIQKNEDAIKGYEKAAENAKLVPLQRYFLDKSAERRTFLVSLNTSAPDLDLRTDIDGSVKGAAHRAWMDVKAFFTDDNDEAMLEEAIRGDKAAIEEYTEVLADTHLPLKTAEVIRAQRDKISADLKVNKDLESLS